ncbi:MAG TPA: asparagine synthase (glutamine-hydrolyzing), partial [Nitrospira sp.]
MVRAIRYRGPDDMGTWCDPSIGLGLGHTRLSILDLSPEGHQPMISASGRFVLSYNGEIYNFKELRTQLEAKGATFRGHSDTEVMLAAFDAWGIEEGVQQFVGMFAFAVWDRETHVLSLVRDRLGIKPLYYGWAGSTFVFGSELKALKQGTAFHYSVSREALSAFMRYGYVPTPFSIYESIFKLPPGCVLSLTLAQARSPQTFSPEPENAARGWGPRRYWSAKTIIESGTANQFKGTEVEALDRLDDLLKTVVGLHMVADVPLGAFLSGGVDSSLVVAMMQTQSTRPVRTFSIGFHEERYNEAVYAKAVAQHLGTQHTELYVSPAEAMAVIPLIPGLYDEPFGDSSQIPTYLVSQLARQHVTVALSGDGGDELFAGYNRYFWGRQLWKQFAWIPLSFRRRLARGIQSFSPEFLSGVFENMRSVVPTAPNLGDKLHKLAELLSMDDLADMYIGLVSFWKNPSGIVLGGAEPVTLLTDRRQWAAVDDFTLRMMALDLVTYLPDDILTKVDRASMGVSLEARVPLLDHRLVEFAWQLPLSLKIRKKSQGKWLLRQVLERYVPVRLMNRPKTGFGIPLDQWLRGPLRAWAEDLLSEDRLKREGFFHPAP